MPKTSLLSRFIARCDVSSRLHHESASPRRASALPTKASDAVLQLRAETMMTKPKYRDCLLQYLNRLFLTDGGMETTLIYHEGVALPCFAAFTLLKTEEGVERLRAYY